MTILTGAIKDVLSGITALPVLWDAPLRAWTTFQIGGPADGLVSVESDRELQEVIGLCRREQIEWRIIGRGSNLLVSDEGFRGIIVTLGEEFKAIKKCNEPIYDGATIINSGAASSFTKLADWACEQGLHGLEFSAGIPGTVGGAVVMNAGAWGDEISDIIHRIYLVGADGAVTVDKKELTFSYRCCRDMSGRFKGYVVTGVDLILKAGKTEAIKQKMQELRRKRMDKQPVGMPNAGSFFKNPEGDSAGRLIDTAGLKGIRIGDAEISVKHANFLVNRGNATAADVIALMAEVQRVVEQKSGVHLEPEVHIL